jgi:hypothetical protein
MMLLLPDCLQAIYFGRMMDGDVSVWTMTISLEKLLYRHFAVKLQRGFYRHGTHFALGDFFFDFSESCCAASSATRPHCSIASLSSKTSAGA